MSTASPEAAASTGDDSATSQLPDASVLDDKTPEWFRTTAAVPLFTIVIGFVFIVFANMRLWHTDLWDHVNYGSRILQLQHLPATEPLLPLAEGMPMTNLAWLSQISFAALAERAGLPALQFTYGLLIAFCLSLIAYRSVKSSGSLLAGLLAVGFLIGVNLPQFLVIRPQLVGMSFFCILVVWALGRQRIAALQFVTFGVMFAVWANCHGSFTLGLAVLGLVAAGRFCDVLTVGRSVRLALRDPHLHRMILLIQICAAAVLVNPYGLLAYFETFRVAANPNIDSMFEWDALTLRSAQGQRVAAGAVLLLMALKMTPRRLRAVEFLLLILFSVLALWSQRMITWWAPVAAIITSVHVAAWVRHSHHLTRRTEPRRATGLWTVVTLGLCWILFAFTNFGIQVVRGRTPEHVDMVSRQSPVNAVQWMHAAESLPQGIMFIPAEWAGYVMHEGPASIESMVNLHVHVIPEEIWTDYLRLLSGPSDWDAMLEKHGINGVLVDAERQPRLLRRLQASEDWQPRYSDHQASFFERTNAI